MHDRIFERGSFFDAQKFKTVLLDEAGQCMEAWTWTL